MILIIGLGNPGKQYEQTPHNIGFFLLDILKERILNETPWQECYQGILAQGKYEDKDVALVKPLTYMNRSGICVKKAIEDLTIDLNNLWVVHDEYDLPLGSIRTDFDRSSAGHKGVQSIIDELESAAFWRVRIGVRPEHTPQNMDAYLTSQKMDTGQQSAIEETLTTFLANAIARGIQRMNLNTKSL